MKVDFKDANVSDLVYAIIIPLNKGSQGTQHTDG